MYLDNMVGKHLFWTTPFPSSDQSVWDRHGCFEFMEFYWTLW